MTPAEKLLILKMAIKCADIGNVTKGQSYATRWTDRVIQEFFEQGDAERSLGLPVTPMLDRHSANVPSMPNHTLAQAPRQTLAQTPSPNPAP